MAYSKIETKDYVLGKGVMTFQEGEDFTGKLRDLGNAPAVNLSVEIEKLEHFSSREGAKEKDKEVFTQKKATGNFTLDDVNLNNMALFFLGDAIEETVQPEATAVGRTLDFAGLDTWQQIEDNDVRDYNISNVIVKDQADVITYVEGEDYEIDYEAGLIRPLSSGGNIAEDDELHLTIDTAALTHYKFPAMVKDKITGHIFFNSHLCRLLVGCGYRKIPVYCHNAYSANIVKFTF